MTKQQTLTQPQKLKPDWRAVLFDLDGTLMDTSEGVLASIRYTTKTLGFPPLSEEKMRTFIGPPVRNSLQRTYHLTEEEADHANEIFRNRYKDHDLFLAHTYEGIPELLSRLKQKGYLLGVATLKREDYAKRLLEHAQLAEYFDVIRGGDVKGKFLKADVLRLCLQDLQAAPEETVLIGDTASDGNGARIAGIRFLAVTFGFGPDSAEKWNSFDPIFVADSADDLDAFLL